jgi:muconolactone D-isomerase
MDRPEYLVEMTTHVPEGTPAETVDDLNARQAVATRELAEQGRLVRLWTHPHGPVRGTGS